MRDLCLSTPLSKGGLHPRPLSVFPPFYPTARSRLHKKKRNAAGQQQSSSDDSSDARVNYSEQPVDTRPALHPTRSSIVLILRRRSIGRTRFRSK